MAITRSWCLKIALTFIFAGITAAQTFTDNTFPNSAWSTTLLPSSAAGAKCDGRQDTSSGTAAPSRTTQHDYPQGWINCAHVWLGGGYAPSQGAIVNLDYSFDLIHYTAKLGGVRYSPLIVQNNTYYWIPLGHSITSASWTPFSQNNLTEASFTKFEGPSERKTPDFSCGGAEMRFGYLTRNYLPGNTTITTKSGIDNWTIRIRTESCKPGIECPPPWRATQVNGVWHCCPDGISENTPEFCCFPACPPGSIQTTVNGVRFCCERNPAGEVCCTPDGSDGPAGPPPVRP